MTIIVDRRRGRRGWFDTIAELMPRDHRAALGLRPLARETGVVVERVFDPHLIEAEWRAFEADAIETPFQTFGFCAGWYRAAVAARWAEPLLLVARDPATRRIIAILPLALSWRGPFRVVTFADHGCADVNLPIIDADLRADPARARSTLRLMLDALPSADFFDLDKMPAAFADGTVNPLILKRGVLLKSVGCHHMPLAAPWETLARERQSAKYRRNLARNVRNLAGVGRVTIRTLDDPADIAAGFEAAAALRTERFAATDRGDILGVAPFRDFYRGLLDRDRAGFHARMTVLEVDGTLVAAEFGLVHAGTQHLVLPALAQDPRWLKHGVGHLLMDAVFAMEAEAGRTSIGLGVGDDAYKTQIGTVRHELHTLRRPLSRAGAVLLAAEAGIARLKASDGIRGFYKRFIKPLRRDKAAD